MVNKSISGHLQKDDVSKNTSKHSIDTKIEIKANKCIYKDWTAWTECEVICKPIKLASTKVRRRIPIDGYKDNCDIIEELYFCDPNVYC